MLLCAGEAVPCVEAHKLVPRFSHLRCRFFLYSTEIIFLFGRVTTESTRRQTPAKNDPAQASRCSDAPYRSRIYSAVNRSEAAHFTE